MSQPKSSNENYREDEIDLRKLFQAIGNGVANVGKAFINVIIRIRRISIKYKMLLIIMSIIGVVAGVLFNKVSKPHYSATMLLSSDYFSHRLVESSIKKLDALCDEEDNASLAKILGIDDEVAINIKGFDFSPIVTEKDVVNLKVLRDELEALEVKNPNVKQLLKQIEIQNKNAFIIIVTVYDNAIIGNLQSSLVNYFRNTPYVKNRIEATKNLQVSLIHKLKNDRIKLDSLKNLFNLNLKINANRKGGAAHLFVGGESSLLDPVSFYSQSKDIYEQIGLLEQRLMLGNDFELIDGFTTFSKPKSPDLIKATAFSMLYAIGLAYLIIVFIEINKYLNRVEQERFKN